MPNPQRVQVGSLHAEFSQLTLPIGLTLDRVVVDGGGLSIQDDPLKFELPAPGSLRVELSGPSLASFLERLAPAGMRGFDVQCRDGKIHVDAVKKVILDVKVHTVLTLRIVDRKAIYVDLESVEAMGASLKNLVQSQLDTINPVVSVDDFPVDATLDRVEIADGRVNMFGQVSPK